MSSAAGACQATSIRFLSIHLLLIHGEIWEIGEESTLATKNTKATKRNLASRGDSFVKPFDWSP
jgi:hypothetical protein